MTSANMPASGMGMPTDRMKPPKQMATGTMSETELESALQDLLGGLPDGDVQELAALAEAMVTEGQT